MSIIVLILRSFKHDNIYKCISDKHTYQFSKLNCDLDLDLTMPNIKLRRHTHTCMRVQTHIQTHTFLHKVKSEDMGKRTCILHH